MFTGLVEGTGTLLRIDRRGPDARMALRADFDPEGFTLGESIAVDGACLTVVSFEGRTFSVDVSAETLSRTTLGSKSPGARFNLERALRLGDRLGGHLVTGHIDGLGTLQDRAMEGRSWKLTFAIPPELSRYVVPKGSIAINGVSLTVNTCEPGRFYVNVIPHTADVTTIGQLKIGEEVNIETDIIGKYVERLLKGYDAQDKADSPSPGIDTAFLVEHGFL
ncbi:riboflavin synthase alpha chain [Desulfacinum hydrothermale DSM 13146]|uniref:Riboflavin synthase n=1 Tax=Desulfacinum hydrothermale DSM 13146 TaxID=1121390 RepID=A0A1W1X6S3_9BACT|nr:riboflavin synthase [Desulfacinum hydrothermale]SMC19636.1 riboflavin synthase alpha chain [Desulfacinum hydrothermale DSM 13146]